MTEQLFTLFFKKNDFLGMDSKDFKTYRGVCKFIERKGYSVKQNELRLYHVIRHDGKVTQSGFINI